MEKDKKTVALPSGRSKSSEKIEKSTNTQKCGIRGDWAVVTGSAHGLGRCFALELAGRGANIILVDKCGANLETVAAEVAERGVECLPIEADFTDCASLEKLCAELNERFDISILINNAGCGGTRNFIGCPAEYIDNILRLNVITTSTLTHRLLPDLLRRQKAYILNVSSMASFTPVGYKTVYPASKRFVADFSRGLREELRGTNVHISVVCPGAMRTNDDVSARIRNQGFWGRISEQRPEYVAAKAIERMLNEKCLIVPGVKNTLNRFFLGLIPPCIKLPLMSDVISREINSACR